MMNTAGIIGARPGDGSPSTEGAQPRPTANTTSRVPAGEARSLAPASDTFAEARSLNAKEMSIRGTGAGGAHKRDKATMTELTGFPGRQAIGNRRTGVEIMASLLKSAGDRTQREGRFETT